MGLRGLSGGPAARLGGERRCAGRHGALVLEQDLLYNDIAAPGEDIFSTLPRALTSSTRPGCVLQGYSDCGPIEFRRGEGTSFSAPQVSAAAAVLLGSRPQLRADQVAALLTRSAVDAESDTGCQRCSSGRDALTGWGVLNVANAVEALDRSLPEPDRFEANDEAATAVRLWGRKGRRIRATVDYWDDPIDVYRIKLVVANAWLRASVVRVAPIPICSCGSLERGASQALQSIGAGSRPSPSLPARSSESAFASGRVAGTSSR